MQLMSIFSPIRDNYYNMFENTLYRIARFVFLLGFVLDVCPVCLSHKNIGMIGITFKIKAREKWKLYFQLEEDRKNVYCNFDRFYDPQDNSRVVGKWGIFSPPPCRIVTSRGHKVVACPKVLIYDSLKLTNFKIGVYWHRVFSLIFY